MKTILSVLAIIICLRVATSGFAANEVFENLFKAKSLKCEFGPGVSTEWEKGKIKTESANFGAPLHYDSIDLEKGTARLIGNQAFADIASFLTLTGISFIETTPMGNINITTVLFEYSDESSKQYKVVQSRHISMMGVIWSSKNGHFS